MKKLINILSTVAAIALTAVTVFAQTKSTLALSPSSISLKGSPGSSTTQQFRLANLTSQPLRFHVEVADVAVEGGKRIFIPPGRSPRSTAILVNIPTPSFLVEPGQQISVPITFIAPGVRDPRGVAVLFMSEAFGADQQTKISISLGAVVDFTIADEIAIDAGDPLVALPTNSSNTIIVEHLTNIGAEPVNARGVAAILDASGNLVGKTVFERKRLFPGEQNSIRAEYAGDLRAGTYRVLCSLEFGDRVMTKTAELIIP